MVGKKVVFLLRGFELQDVFLYIQTKTILPKTLKVLGGKNPRNSDFKTSEKMDDDKLTQYNFRMTSDEKKQLKEMAAKSGRTVSAYIRAKLFGGEVATINAVEFLKGYTTQIYEMQKIGNNVNQLAHYANICIKGGVLSEDVVKQMDEYLGELVECERQIISLQKKIIR